jgi:hypothetical protein
MQRVLAVVTAILGWLVLSQAAQAGVTVQVNLSTQRMAVTVDGKPRHAWAISSGREGYRTPTGTYRPGHLATMHRSRKYGMAPMPHSIFFRGGYAIHGTTEGRRIGRTASHGCIRLPRAAAAELFRLVQSRKAETRIVITGSAEVADARASGRLPRAAVAGTGVQKGKAVAARAKTGPAKAVPGRRAPVQIDNEGMAYGFAPMQPSSLDGFWYPRSRR